MTSVTLNGREFKVSTTGFKHVAYTLTSGRLVCKGVRSQTKPDVIMVLVGGDSRLVGYFSETTGRELVAR